MSDGPARYGGGFTAVPTEGGSELRYEGWATTTGPLAEREEAWARQAQREAEAELAAIKEALEAAPDPLQRRTDVLFCSAECLHRGHANGSVDRRKPG